MATGLFTLNEFSSLASGMAGEKKRMPVMFVGHGNPMNAIEQNEFSLAWKKIGAAIERPKAILCVSAHWMTSGKTLVTAMAKPETIHDFYGFPDELFAVQYPAPGAVEVAQETISLVKKTTVQPAHDWGLDHGCWSVLKPMFPKADIPVFQLSLDLSKPPQWHYELAMELKALRDKGVLIIGSGNIVHNLGRMQWNDNAFDWAIEFDNWSTDRLLAGDHAALVNYSSKGKIAELSIPTNEHYLPLLYAIALQDKQDDLRFFNEKTMMGSISMRSVLLG
ncbi:MAG: 4,5-DOPA dioxygenase extradiol [Bacteroidia bacterium]